MSLADITDLGPGRILELPPGVEFIPYDPHPSVPDTGYDLYGAKRRRVWLPTDMAGWYAAPWWALTWVLTFGRYGRLPWRWEEAVPKLDVWTTPGVSFIGASIGIHGYQPTVSTTDPSNPPDSCSGVPTANVGTR